MTFMLYCAYSQSKLQLTSNYMLIIVCCNWSAYFVHVLSCAPFCADTGHVSITTSFTVNSETCSFLVTYKHTRTQSSCCWPPSRCRMHCLYQGRRRSSFHSPVMRCARAASESQARSSSQRLEATSTGLRCVDWRLCVLSSVVQLKLC